MYDRMSGRAAPERVGGIESGSDGKVSTKWKENERRKERKQRAKALSQQSPPAPSRALLKFALQGQSSLGPPPWA